MPYGVVDRETVCDVAASAVDVERDGTVVVVRQVAQPLDRLSCGVFLYVANQIDIAKALDDFAPQLGADGVDELGDQAIAQVSHRKSLSHAVGPQPRGPNAYRDPSAGMK